MFNRKYKVPYINWDVIKYLISIEYVPRKKEIIVSFKLKDVDYYSTEWCADEWHFDGFKFIY